MLMVQETSEQQKDETVLMGIYLSWYPSFIQNRVDYDGRDSIKTLVLAS